MQIGMRTDAVCILVDAISLLKGDGHAHTVN